MAPRPIASGTVSFGMVSIPVKMFSATQPQSALSFNMLHKKCGSRLKQHYICSADGEKVEREDTVKGYEFAKDQYVTFSKDELVALEEKSTQTIEIAEFVPADKVDPVFFEKPYYLSPDKGGEKAYRLLAQALEKTGRSALARYAARGKGYLVLLRPVDGKLIMQQLVYADEVRPLSEIEVPDVTVKEPELKLAIQLVEASASDEFRPEGYQDEVKTRIRELIQQKIEGKEISAAPPETGKAQIIDLMEALKQSLQKRSEERAGAGQEGKAEEAERKAPKRSGRPASEAKAAKAAKK